MGLVLRRVDATPNQRSFMRPSNAQSVSPPASHDTCFMVTDTTTEPKNLCEPTLPRVWPDTNNTSVQLRVDSDEYSAFLTKQCDNVATLEQAFKEARKPASDNLDVLWLRI